MKENIIEKLKDVKINYDRESLIKLIGFKNSRIIEKLFCDANILTLNLLVDFSKCDIHDKSMEFDVEDENDLSIWVINNNILIKAEFFISEDTLENFIISKKPLNIINHIKDLDCILDAEVIGKGSNIHKHRLIKELESRINKSVLKYFLNGNIQITLEID